MGTNGGIEGPNTSGLCVYGTLGVYDVSMNKTNVDSYIVKLMAGYIEVYSPENYLVVERQEIPEFLTVGIPALCVWDSCSCYKEENKMWWYKWNL